MANAIRAFALWHSPGRDREVAPTRSPQLMRHYQLEMVLYIVGGVSNPDWTGFAQEIRVRNPSNNI